MSSNNIGDLEQFYTRLLSEFQYVGPTEIPNIDLYMDQVTTFMEQRLAAFTRDPDGDKILTKTMINNYAKNDLLIPPVKKKYSKDHMILLLIIYYMKSFLSIADIEEVLRPIKENYIGKEDAPIDLSGIYARIYQSLNDEVGALQESARQEFSQVAASYTDLPEEDRLRLQRFELIMRMSAEIYIKKLYIERLLDEERTEREAAAAAEKARLAEERRAAKDKRNK